jgi:hypothetical protein
VGGRRRRHFNGTRFKPHKLSENAATPTRRVHAVLGAFDPHKTRTLLSDFLALIEKNSILLHYNDWRLFLSDENIEGRIIMENL